MDDYIKFDGYCSQEITYFSSRFYNGFTKSCVPDWWTETISEILGRTMISSQEMQEAVAAACP